MKQFLSDEQILLLFDPRNGAMQGADELAKRFARSIESAVVAKLADKLKDAERYVWLTKYAYIDKCYTDKGVILEVHNTDREVPVNDSVSNAIDAAINEQKDHK